MINKMVYNLHIYVIYFPFKRILLPYLISENVRKMVEKETYICKFMSQKIYHLVVVRRKILNNVEFR